MVLETPATVEEIVREEFKDIPMMIEVARCESGFVHFKENGELLRGHINAQDVGVMQINEKYHLKESKALGHDIHTLAGNLAYARYLYEKNGLRDWRYSEFCWSK